MKKKTVCIALEVLAVALIAVALVLLLRKPGKTEPISTTPIENEAVTLPGHEELPITTGAFYQLISYHPRYEIEKTAEILFPAARTASEHLNRRTVRFFVVFTVLSLLLCRLISILLLQKNGGTMKCRRSFGLWCF